MKISVRNVLNSKSLRVVYSIRFFKGAHHGFGYSRPLRKIPNAMKGPNKPIFYINDQGAFLDLYTGQPIPGADDDYIRDLGWMERGAVTTGTKAGQSEAFVEDMIGFFKVQLKP